MLKKIGGVVALVALCALSLFLLNCGSSSSRPSGLLYVLTQGSNGLGNNVSSFAINFYTGNLTLINSNATTCPTAATVTNTNPCGLPVDILLSPSDSQAFVLDQGVPCVVQSGQCGSSPNGVAPSIYPYTVNSDGSLSSPGTAVNWTCIGPTGTACSSSNAYPDTASTMVRDAAGQFLFVIDEGVFPSPTTCPLVGRGVSSAGDATNFVGCPSISVFAMTNNSTALTLVSQSATYQSPFFLSKVPSALSPLTFTAPGASASQELLFVTNNYDLCTIACLPQSAPQDNTVSVYNVSSSGVLTEQAYSPYTVPAADPVSVLAVNTFLPQQTQGGIFVYVGQGGGVGQIYPFQLCVLQNAGCTAADVNNNLMVPLTTCPSQSCNIPPSAVGSDPVAMLVDPTNNFLYVLSEGSNQVAGFKIATTGGTLGKLAPPSQPTGSEPVSMSLYPSLNNSGQFLYVSNSSSDNITGFTLGTTDGSMGNAITVIAPASPSGLAAN